MQLILCTLEIKLVIFYMPILKCFVKVILSNMRPKKEAGSLFHYMNEGVELDEPQITGHTPTFHSVFSIYYVLVQGAEDTETDKT